MSVIDQPGAPPAKATGGIREAVIAGAKRDFRDTVEVPAGFPQCFVSGFRRALTAQRLEALGAIHASRGEAAAARALNGFGAPVGDACGGREWVPELAAAGLRRVR